MAEPAEKLYRAEYAKSGRASCKKCGESIAKDSLRLALMVQVPRGGAAAGGGRVDPAAPLGTAAGGASPGLRSLLSPRRSGAARPRFSLLRGRSQPIFNRGAFAGCRVCSSAGGRGSPARSAPRAGGAASPAPPGCRRRWSRSGAKFAVRGRGAARGRAQRSFVAVREARRTRLFRAPGSACHSQGSVSRPGNPRSMRALRTDGGSAARKP